MKSFINYMIELPLVVNILLWSLPVVTFTQEFTCGLLTKKLSRLAWPMVM